MSTDRRKIVLGTRGSALALAQAELAEEALVARNPGLEVERRIIRTTGDRRTDVALAEVAKVEGHLDKGVFIKELEVALVAGEIDLAVHSMKDVPSELEERFEIVAVLPRAAVGDVLVRRDEGDGATGGLEGLRQGARVATSSVRRQRQMRFLRPDLGVADIRGNVPTRLRKLATNPDLDGLLLAEAGLRRLGHGEVIDLEGVTLRVAGLDPELFLPAAGQGAVGFEIRAGDEELASIAGAVNCAGTMEAVTAERAFLRLLGAGCDTPVGVLARIAGERMRLRARVFEDGEERPLVGEVEAARGDPAVLAGKLLKGLKRKEQQER